MRYLRFATAGILAMLAVAVAMTATASAALPEFLPTTAGTKLTTKSGVSKLEGNLAIECTASTGSGETTATEPGKSGTSDILFTGCKAVGVNCKGLDDTTAGSILAKATTKLRGILGGGAALVDVIKPIHIECSVLLAEITGSVACPITTVNKKVKTTEHYTVTCATSAKKQVLKEVDNAAGTGMETAGLTVEENHNGKPFEGGEATTQELTASVESEVMA
jgi:hypothetical protein